MNKYYKGAKSFKSTALLCIAVLVILPGATISAANTLPVSLTPSDSLIQHGNHSGNSKPNALSTIPSPHAKKTFTQVEAGSYYSIGLLADGSVWTWGRNLFGELGLPNTKAVSKIQAPVRLSTLSDITSITTSGAGYQLAVKKNGTVWEWGVSFDKSQKTQPPRQIHSLTGISHVSSNHKINFALKKDGTVWAWKRDLGSGDSSNPVQVKGLSKVTSLDTAGGITFALDSTGALWMFSTEQKENQLILSTPSRIKGIPAIKKISSSFPDQIFAIDTTGKAWKLPVDTSSPKIKWSGKPVPIYPKLKVQDIQAGYNYAVLLTDQGDVWTYGKKPAGKEGKVKGLSGIVSIAAGEYHSLAIDSKGQVWGWGGNKRSELGVPRNSVDGMVYTPERLQTPIDVIVNGELLTSSFPSIMNNNQIIIPLKDTVKALGAELEITTSSDGTANTLYTIQLNQTSASFHIGGLEAEINGKTVTLSSPVYLSPGAIMFPASLLKQMGLDVTWNSKLSELSISSN